MATCSMHVGAGTQWCHSVKVPVFKVSGDTLTKATTPKHRLEECESYEYSREHCRKTSENQRGFGSFIRGSASASSLRLRRCRKAPWA
eukprot:2854155-Alexandrium_andersonii.AAC.1